VYLLSVLVLKERITWLKSLSVAVSVGGVVMVSVAPQHTDASDTHATPIGYLWLMVSVFAYAGYEVRALYVNVCVSLCLWLWLCASCCVPITVWLWARVYLFGGVGYWTL
jgi:drug/metabolite transporter (DMT)-like permease